MTRTLTTWTLALLALSALFAAACSSNAVAPATDEGGASVAVADGDGDTNDASPTASINGDGGTGDGATVGSVDRDDSSSSVSFVSSAAARTAELEAYEFVMESSMTGLPETTGPLTFTAEGAIDARNQRMRMTLDMNSLFDAMPGNVSDEELELMRALIGDGLIEMLVDGDTAYMSWSLFSTLFGADTKWVSFTDEGSGGDLFEGFGGLSMGQFGSGPDGYLDFFSSLGSLDEAGTDVLRGVETIPLRRRDRSRQGHRARRQLRRARRAAAAVCRAGRHGPRRDARRDLDRRRGLHAQVHHDLRPLGARRRLRPDRPRRDVHDLRDVQLRRAAHDLTPVARRGDRA